MINAHRAARLIAIEDDILDILDYAPTIADDPDILDILDSYESELIRAGVL